MGEVREANFKANRVWPRSFASLRSAQDDIKSINVILRSETTKNLAFLSEWRILSVGEVREANFKASRVRPRSFAPLRSAQDDIKGGAARRRGSMGLREYDWKGVNFPEIEKRCYL
jgi:hypothetical protein